VSSLYTLKGAGNNNKFYGLILHVPKKEVEIQICSYVNVAFAELAKLFGFEKMLETVQAEFLSLLQIPTSTCVVLWSRSRKGWKHLARTGAGATVTKFWLRLQLLAPVQTQESMS
jgi:hypothetical protein